MPVGGFVPDRQCRSPYRKGASMILRLIVAVATAVASGAVARGQGPSVEECVIEPIVIGGTVDGEMVVDASVVSDAMSGAISGDMLSDAPLMPADA